MSKNLGEDLQSQAASLAAKLRGLAFLFSRMNLDAENEDREAFSGIAELLSELAAQSAEIRNQLDLVKLPGAGAKNRASAAKSGGNSGGSSPAREKKDYSEPTIEGSVIGGSPSSFNA